MLGIIHREARNREARGRRSGCGVLPIVEPVGRAAVATERTFVPESHVPAIVEPLEDRVHLSATFEAFISGASTGTHGQSVSFYLWTTGGTASKWVVNWDGVNSTTYNAPPGGFPTPYKVTHAYANANPYNVTATATPSGGGAAVTASYALNSAFGYSGGNSSSPNNQGETTYTPSGASGDAGGRAMAIDTSGSTYNGYVYVASLYGSGGAVTRFTPDGAVDTTFNQFGSTPGTVVISSFTPRAIAVSGDGNSIAVGGQSSGGYFAVALVNASTGAPTWTKSDLSNAENGAANAVTFETDGLGVLNVFAAGWFSCSGGATEMAVTELLASNGSNSSGWNSGNGIESLSVSCGCACAEATALVDLDGYVDAVAVAGWTDVSGGSDFVLVELNDDGSFNTGFNHSGIVTANFGTIIGSAYGATNIPSTDYAYALAFDPDTSALVAAGSTTAFGGTKVAVGEWNWQAGTPVYGFGPYGYGDGLEVGTTGIAKSAWVDTSAPGVDSIYLGGSTGGVNGDLLASKFTKYGIPDTTFGDSGSIVVDMGDGTSNSNDLGYGIAVEGDGSILLGGSTTPSGGSGKIALVDMLESNTLTIS